MAITEAFRNAVSKRDITSIRIMMKDSLLVDPAFAEFNEMNRLAGHIAGLYDDHDGREFNEDEKTWNDDYMNKLKVQIVGNFSRERLEHLKKVIRHLRPVASRPYTQTSRPDEKVYPHREQQPKTGRVYPANTGQDEHYNRSARSDSGHSDRTVKIGAASAAGAVAGGIVAKVVGGFVLAGVVLGAVAAGVVTSVVTKEDE